MPKIDEQSPTWRAVESWALKRLARARKARETASADLRHLDYLLGEIHALNALVSQAGRQEHKPEVETVDMGIAHLTYPKPE